MSQQRMSQVNELIRSKINEFITRELEIPSEYFITLTRVDTAPDLRHTKAFINVIPDNKRGSALRLLRTNQKNIQKYIGRNIAMKFTPKISFEIDSQAVYGNEIDQLLDSIDFSKHEEQ